MNDESLRLHLLAIRKRRQFLAKLYSENGSAPKRAGLVALSRAVYLLATRYVMAPEWPGHDVSEEAQLNWELEWYSNYLRALAVLTPRLQGAFRSGAITPRDVLTRAPMDLGQMSHWLHLDVKVVIDASAKTFWADPIPDTDASLWADASLMTSGVFVTAKDIAAWAEGEGIAAPGEVAAMLSDHDQLAATTPAEGPEKDALPVLPVPVVTPAEPENNATPKERRAAHDMTTERGCRRLILEQWDAIELLHGATADARQVLRVITRHASNPESLPSKKTVQNRLIDLRNEKLIP